MTRVPARDFEPAGLIRDYVAEERDRAVALVKAISRGAGKDFLLFCLEAPYYPDEIETARQRFAELTPDVEDLL